MIVRPEHIVELIWIGRLMSWLTASFWSDRAQKHLAAPQTWTYRAALIAGGFLLAPPTAWLLAEAQLWQLGHRGTFVLLAIMYNRPSAPGGRASTSGGFGQALSRTKRGTRSSIGPLCLHSPCCRAIRDSGCRSDGPSAARCSPDDLWLLAEGPLRGAVSEDRTWFGVLPSLLPPRANDRPLHNPR